MEECFAKGHFSAPRPVYVCPTVVDLEYVGRTVVVVVVVVVVDIVDIVDIVDSCG